MTLDITQIPFDEIKPNSILVIRLPSGLSMSESDREAVDNLTSTLRTRLHESVQVLIMSHGTEVFSVSEEVMNGAGWYRKTSTS